MPSSSTGEDGRHDAETSEIITIITRTCSRLEQERDKALEEVASIREQIEVLAVATKSLTGLVTNALETDIPAPSSEADAQDDLAATTTTHSMPKEEGGRVDDSSFLQGAVQQLEGTGFSALANVCKRLTEKLRLTVLEADDALAGERSANEAKLAAEQKLRIASRALSKLCGENADLKKENAKLKKDRRRVAQEVSDYVQELRDEMDAQLDEAYAIMAHERALSTPVAHTTCTTTKVNTFIGSDDDESTALLSFPSPLSTCMSSSTPAASLVTDGGSPTLRFRPSCTTGEDDDMSTLSLLDRPRAESEDDDGDNSKEEDCDNDNDEPENDMNESRPPVSVGDFIGMVMNRRDVDRKAYDIPFSSSHIGLRMRAIPKDLPKDGMRWHDLDSTEPSSAEKEKPSRELFLVCGFRDYDLTLAKRPELGARLVAVDGMSVEFGEKEWTLKKVCDEIRSRGGREGGVCLTFRNDVLSKDDIARLNRILVPKKKKEQALSKERKEAAGAVDIRMPFLKLF